MNGKERQFIEWLAREFAERRSDVNELCNSFLETGEIPENPSFEHRYIQATIPDTDFEIEYDTLTTEISYHTPLEQWSQCINHVYTND